MKSKKIKSKKKPSVARRKNVVVETTSRRGKLTPLQKINYHEAMDGNAFWQQRSKHGRNKLFASPKLMLEAALEYFKWCDANPDKKSELVKYEGSAEEVSVSVKRPYTMQGLTRYLDCNVEYFRDFQRGLRAKDQKLWTQEDKDFSGVIKIIKEIVEDQQVSGAMTGHFNGNIVSRLLGLIDKHDVKSDDLPIQAPIFNIYNSGPPLASNEEEIKP